MNLVSMYDFSKRNVFELFVCLQINLEMDSYHM